MATGAQFGKGENLFWSKHFFFLFLTIQDKNKTSFYFQGNYDTLKGMTGWHPTKVLYFGDHPYADLADLSMHHGWRTCAIIDELEEEIEKANDLQMKINVNWSNELQKLLNTYQDCAEDPECKVLLDEWKDELEQIRYFS